MTLQRPRAAVAAAALVSVLLRTAGAANASAPHPHSGLIPRLQLEGKPEIKLSQQDVELIESGELWLQSGEVGGIGRGVGIRDIAAPPDIVYGQIADLKGYVGKVPMLSGIDVYSSETVKGEVVEKAMYTIRVVPGYTFEYYVEHHGSQKQGALLFYLDYGRYSDFNDMQGKWYLEKHPSKEGWTRVYYQCDLKLFGYAPRIVKTLLTSKGLISAIGWVKRESEKRAPTLAGSTAHPAPRDPAALGVPTFAGLAVAAVAAMILRCAALTRRRRAARL